MKYFVKSYKQLIVLLLCAFVLSCSLPLSGHTTNGNAVVTVNASNKGGKSILPTFTTPVKYRFTITGGPTLVEPIENGTGMLQVTLAYGTYNFFVEGFDSSNSKTCESSVVSKDIQTSGIEQNLTLAPLFEAGDGTVSVSLSWPNALAVSKVETSCVKMGEEESFSEITISQNSATYSEIKAAGNYQLIFKVWKGSELLTTRFEVVQVAAAMTSSASILLESKDLDFSSIVASETCVLALKSDGSLWAWGKNEYGELGNGTKEMSTVPVRIGLLSSWVQISVESDHVLALKSDGTLWGWGDNGYNKINSLASSEYLSPVQIGTDSDWSQISAGSEFSCAIKRDGSLWAWGAGSYGQIGDGFSLNRTVPTRIGTSTDWASLSSGYAFTIALKKDGTLWAWGRNNAGQLGCNSKINQNVPLQIGTDSSWINCSAGYDYVLAVKADGTLWGWGNNDSQQLCAGGVVYQLTPIQIGSDKQWKKPFAGYRHSFALDNTNALYGWGSNNYGQLSIYSVKAGSSVNVFSVPTLIDLPASCKQLAVAGFYSVCFIEDGRLLTWGKNDNGQFGTGFVSKLNMFSRIDNKNDWTEIASNDYHSLVLKSDGSLWSWGDNGAGKLGFGNTIAYHLVPGKIGTDLDWTQVQAGCVYTLALKKDGSLWNWGSYESVCPGGESLYIPSRIGLVANWKKISTGSMHSFAIKNDNSLWSWGRNSNGELGLGTSDSIVVHTPTQVGTDLTWATIAAGDSFAIGLKNDGSLWAWGKNTNGQLGIGSFENKNSPVQIGIDTDWAEVRATDSHVIARKTNGTIWVWGKEVVSVNYVWKDKENPFQVGASSDWTRVFAGSQCCFAIKADGSLWAWGNNSNGEFGNGTSDNQSTPIRIGDGFLGANIVSDSGHTIILKSDGSLWAWGTSNATGGWNGNTFIPTPNGFSIY